MGLVNNVDRYQNNEPVHRLINAAMSVEDLQGYATTLELILMKVADTATFADPEDQKIFEGILRVIHSRAGDS